MIYLLLWLAIGGTIGVMGLYRELQGGESFSIADLILIALVFLVLGPFMAIMYVCEYHKEKIDAVKHFFTKPVLGGKPK